MKLPISLLATTLMAGGALMAQTPAPAQTPVTPKHEEHANRGPRSERFVARLTKRLGLTSDQQNQVKAIFKESREQAKALAPKLREERMALREAVKSDSVQKIDQITQQNAQLNAQREAIHAKAMAKVYGILTPDQKAKFDQMSEHRAVRHEHRAANSSAKS